MAGLLRQGSRGQDVANVQDALNTAGKSKLPALAVDGIFGAKTRARVVEFQTANGLGADGLVGPITRSKLQPHMRPGGATIIPPGGGGGGGPRPGGGGGGGGGGAGEGDVVGQVVRAAKGALGIWRSSARFSSVKVMGVTAIGSPGCVSGPSLSGLILGMIGLGALSPADRKVAEASAKGIGGTFLQFQSSIHVPGLPWYPAFAFFPGPAAPPMPNIPSPLAGMCNPGLVSIGVIQGAINGQLSGASADAIAKVALISAQVGGFYTGWVASTSVKLVLGHGQVPTFAPPIVPGGPVVNGSVISSGGHF